MYAVHVVHAISSVMADRLPKDQERQFCETNSANCHDICNLRFRHDFKWQGSTRFWDERCEGE